MRTQPIRSFDNPRYKAARRLVHSRARRQQERIAIFGFREALRAIRAGATIDEVFICPELVSAEQRADVERELAALAAPIWEIPLSLIRALEYGERNEGLLVIAAHPSLDMRQLRLPPKSLIVVLEGAEKPGNIGAVARTAIAAGADALILADPVCDLFHPNCIRASLGCIFSLQTASGPSAEIRDWLVAQRISIVAARTDAETVYTSVDLRSAVAIVLGSESAGLSDVWGGLELASVRVPMRGDADSLNVSVTAAVLLYEANRQRTA